MVSPSPTPASRSHLRPRAAREAFAQIPPAALVRLPAAPQKTVPAASEPLVVPGNLLCPISLLLMRNPVRSPATGITYDRKSVELWEGSGLASCPVTGRPLLAKDMEPDEAKLRMIKEWHRAARRGSGADPERAPEALLLAVMSAAARRGNSAACGLLAAKVMALGKESRQCAVAAGAGRALSSAFFQLAGQPAPASGALEKVLAALAVFLPLDGDDDEARHQLAAPASLDAVVETLSRGEPLARASAAAVLREIAASSSPDALDAVCAANKMYDAFFEVLEMPAVSPGATKAVLVTAYRLATAAAGAAARRMVDRGMVQLLVDMLSGVGKGTAEKALAVLDSLLTTEEGRDAASAHALAVPVLSEKARNATGVAAELAASALRRLGHGISGEGPCETEALRMRRMGGVTIESATDLLSILNLKGSRARRGGAKGIEMVGSKGTKKPL